MNDFVDINDTDIIDINSAIIGTKTNINNAFGGYKASIEYIESIEEKIASAVVSIARNHSFKDGNKRTAVSVYYTMCDLNNVTPKANIQDIILDIVNNHLNYKEASKILFDIEEDEEEVEESIEEKAPEAFTKFDSDKILNIIHEVTTMSIDSLYDLADNNDLIGDLYPEQVDELLGLLHLDELTLDILEKRIIAEANIEANKAAEQKADEKEMIEWDIRSLQALVEDPEDIHYIKHPEIRQKIWDVINEYTEINAE